MAVSWEWFAGRRSVTLREILEAENNSSYPELVEKLRLMGVRAPAEKQVAWMFNEKADKIHIPADPSMSMDEMLEARKKITNIIMEDDPDALVPQMKIDDVSGGLKPVGGKTDKDTSGTPAEPKKTPQRRKRRVRKTKTVD